MRISDWSSDVCSSDLGFGKTIGEADGLGLFALDRVAEHQDFARHADADTLRQAPHQTIIRRQADAAEGGTEAAVGIDDHKIARRSDERRVGKELVGKFRSRWSPEH